MRPHPDESLRLFFALWPDDATRSALQRLQTGLHGRIVPYANLHLTLHFLGKQPATLLPALKTALTRLPATSLTLRFDRIGYFSRSRVVWSGMHRVPEQLLLLHRELQQELETYEVRGDDKARFTPHVTLAREARELVDPAFEPFTWQADQIALVRSDTRPEGPLYQVVFARALDRPYRLSSELELPPPAAV